MSGGFACSCGQRHVGPFPINMLMPIGWDGPETYEDDAALDMTRSFISSNYCVWQGESFALRVRLPVAIHGAAPMVFMFTGWANVMPEDFKAYVHARNTNTLNNNVQFPARLINRLAGYHDTANLVGAAFQQEDGAPPLFLLTNAQPFTNRPDHPLILDQRHGIGFDKMMELFAIYGHSMNAETVKA